MSQEDVAHVRGLFEKFSRRGLDAAFDDYHLDLVYHPREDEPDASVHVGRDSFERLIRGWYEAFPEITFDIKDVTDAGDDLVVCSTILHARGGASGVDVNDPYVFVYKLRDGLVIEGWEYRTTEEALEAIRRRSVTQARDA
ncbi:MAG TPA: nuclear transport factor 2 family protein [Solirubrobacteraceae bacterium]|nr:nuclear transport factor 2 family protein [Solirubrobacteraceae bacterium]